VTIPKAIRESLNLASGVTLRLTVDRSGRIIITPLTLGIEDLIGILPKPPNALTVEEADAVVAETTTGTPPNSTSSS
jgi:AbrB family looped-hinge helix DNA binding protein